MDTIFRRIVQRAGCRSTLAISEVLMFRTAIIAIAMIALRGLPLAGQDSSYAGLETRQIKALSAEQIAGYLDGDGMGMALAAELNSYPGPKHVLELADSLRLTDDQHSRVEKIADEMKVAAVRLGTIIVDREARLDSLFAGGGITDQSLEALLAELGRLQGELRYAHLRAHLATRAVLTEHQRMLYDGLRGYGHTEEHQHHHDR